MSRTGVNVSPNTRISLYSQARYLPEEFKKDIGLLIPLAIRFADPAAARSDPQNIFDEGVVVGWEPHLADGPTSSRFAVVDYNADSGTLEPPAVWDASTEAFLDHTGQPFGPEAARSFQFHQVSIWALLQNALAFFEDGAALGRPISWAFEGNRLIVVPHAGYGQNAYYDRASQSIQFYYFGSDKSPVYTCLYDDIVHHEFGHAVLDGIRPLLSETIGHETAGFHEFMGDFTAILLTLNNHTMRRQQIVLSGGFEEATKVASIAEEFGLALSGRPLRTALNDCTMSDMAGETSPHRLSEVLTGAMYDLLIATGRNFRTKRGLTSRGAQAILTEATRILHMAVQPLDLLPPVEVTFRDYALAVCRSQQLSDPLDREGFYAVAIEIFRKRQILTESDEAHLLDARGLAEQFSFSVPMRIDDMSRSRAAAYRFVDDNREDLLIPARHDFFIVDLYDAIKRSRQYALLPRQIVLQYAWREDVPLVGARFKKFSGRTTTMLCGGTVVFSETGSILSWMTKPGSQPYGGKMTRAGRVARTWAAALSDGIARRTALLDDVAAQIAAGRLGSVVGSDKGLLGSHIPAVIAEEDGGLVRFRLSPHLHLSDDRDTRAAAAAGERQWEISC